MTDSLSEIVQPPPYQLPDPLEFLQYNAPSISKAREDGIAVRLQNADDPTHPEGNFPEYIKALGKKKLIELGILDQGDQIADSSSNSRIRALTSTADGGAIYGAIHDFSKENPTVYQYLMDSQILRLIASRNYMVQGAAFVLPETRFKQPYRDRVTEYRAAIQKWETKTGKHYSDTLLELVSPISQLLVAEVAKKVGQSIEELTR